MQTLQTFLPSSFPLSAHVFCPVEVIALAVFPAKQVAMLISFWLHLCDCASRLDRDDSVSSAPGAWPWLDNAPSALSLVSHWPTLDGVSERENRLMSSQGARGSEWHTGGERTVAANFGYWNIRYRLSGSQLCRNMSKCATHSHTQKGLMQLLSPQAFTSWDLYVLKHADTVRLSSSSQMHYPPASCQSIVWSSVWSVGGHATGNRNVSDEMLWIFVS